MNKMEVIDSAIEVEVSVDDKVISDLRKRLTGLKANSHSEYEQVKAGIAEVSKLRTGVETARKRLVEPHVKSQKAINATARMAKESLLEIETPLRAEKRRVDDKAERLREESEKKERLAIEAKELAERNALEAEEEAKREENRKANEAEQLRLTEMRHQLEDERRVIQDELRAINKEREAIKEKARKERDAKEAVEQAARDKEEQAKSDVAEKVRADKQKAEQERLAEERKPDRVKLEDFADKIENLKPPQLKTSWGNDRLAVICDYLQSACDAAYTETRDDMVAAEAVETVTEQTP